MCCTNISTLQSPSHFSAGVDKSFFESHQWKIVTVVAIAAIAVMAAAGGLWYFKVINTLTAAYIAGPGALLLFGDIAASLGLAIHSCLREKKCCSLDGPSGLSNIGNSCYMKGPLKNLKTSSSVIFGSYFVVSNTQK